MTRSELFTKLSEDFPLLSKAQIELAARRIFEDITETLVDGNRVELRGFGAFSARVQKPRLGRNPRTGDPVEVPEKQYPFFKASKRLVERLSASDRERA